MPYLTLHLSLSPECRTHYGTVQYGAHLVIPETAYVEIRLHCQKRDRDWIVMAVDSHGAPRCVGRLPTREQAEEYCDFLRAMSDEPK